LLRFYTIAPPGRVVTQDVEFHGCPLKAGDRVVLATPAGDRDPAHFPDAHQVVLDRQPNAHFAFGAGPHRCVGSHLARLEIRVAIEEWHAVIPDYRIEPGAVLSEHGGVIGLVDLPLILGK
jgi:cytochrome P450